MSTFLLLDKGPENQFAGWALLLAREALHPCCSPPGGSGSVHVMTPQGRRCSSARSSIWDCCQFCRRIWPMSLFSVFHIIAAIISLQWYKLLICHKNVCQLLYFTGKCVYYDIRIGLTETDIVSKMWRQWPLLTHCVISLLWFFLDNISKACFSLLCILLKIHSLIFGYF